MTRTRRRLVVAGLFAALVVLLLWFQGILFHHDHVPGPAPARASVPAGAVRARVTERTVDDGILLRGTVEAVDPADVAARVTATILAVHVREDDVVEAGAPLVDLDDTDARAHVAQAEAALRSATSTLEVARLAWERAQRLRERAASTEQDWEAARATHEVATASEARVRAALDEARTASGWYRVTAPFRGRVAVREAEPGELATPGRRLLVLVRDEHVRFAVPVPATACNGLRAGTATTVEFDGLGSRAATVTRVVPTTDARTGTRTVHLELADARGVEPGRTGRWTLARGQRTARVVPAAAIERIGQIERVRAVRDGAIVPVIVRVGTRHGDDVEVLGGLGVGEEVVLP